MTLANEQRRKAQGELDSEIGVADAAGIVALLFHGVLRRSDVGALCCAPRGVERAACTGGIVAMRPDIVKVPQSSAV